MTSCFGPVLDPEWSWAGRWIFPQCFISLVFNPFSGDGRPKEWEVNFGTFVAFIERLQRLAEIYTFLMALDFLK